MNILISGGTGFFGQAFVSRILAENEYNRICIFSRDEAKQAVMRRKFNDDPRLRFLIGDIRDRDRLETAMIGIDVVIHGAALKRIEVGQYAPGEVVKTNINGSMNIVDMAFKNKVKKVILLSSDKAYNPISPYGQSKAIAETLFLNANNTHGQHGPKYAVCRYGNVAGSTGSVIPIWRQKKAEGKSAIITDPGCTRFWMTASQAVDLVLQTIEYMPKCVNIPTLPAYKLADLAEAMEVKTLITGLQGYEKQHECMTDGNCSNTARRMSVEELREALEQV